MRRGMRMLAATAVLALALTGCGQDDEVTPTVDAGAEPEAPVETVTVPGPTETVTVTATPGPAETVTVTAEPTAEPTGGSTAPDPCATLEDGAAMAFVIVTTPSPGQSVSSGFDVSGCANTNEASYVWELLDGREGVLAEGFGSATCGTGCVGDFSFSVDYEVGRRQVGTLRVFETSAKDGSDVHVNAIPVVLE